MEKCKCGAKKVDGYCPWCSWIEYTRAKGQAMKPVDLGNNFSLAIDASEPGYYWLRYNGLTTRKIYGPTPDEAERAARRMGYGR